MQECLQREDGWCESSAVLSGTGLGAPYEIGTETVTDQRAVRSAYSECCRKRSENKYGVIPAITENERIIRHSFFETETFEECLKREWLIRVVPPKVMMPRSLCESMGIGVF